MRFITEIIREHKYRIVATNKQKRYAILAIQECETNLWVPFDFLPSKDFFELTREPSGNNEIIHETGVIYG